MTAKTGKRGLGRAFWVMMAVGLVLLGGVLYVTNRMAREGQEQVAQLGGPFELTDMNGRRFTEANLKGKYTLLYFGYTFCPDICPTELTIIAETLDRLGDLRKKFRVVMVSVDPERDTPEVLKEYMSNFGPEFIGLTGTPEQIRKMAKQWRAYYRKVPDPNGEGYSMDHSAVTYLLDTNGKYLRHFAYGTPPERMAKGILEAIRHAEGKGKKENSGDEKS